MSPIRDRAALFGLLAVIACGGDDAGDLSDAAAPVDSGTGEDAAPDDACEPWAPPPGPRIAVPVIRPGAQRWDPYLFDLSGSLPACPVRITPESPSTLSGLRIRWSPDGMALAYSAEGAIYTVDASGPVPTSPRRVSPPGTSSGWAFDWSPDSRWLAFSADDAAGDRDGYLVEIVDGVPGTALDALEGEGNSAPAWRAAGGGFLMFTTDTLYWVEMGLDGPEVPAPVTSADVMETQWTASGDRLAFSVRGATRSDVFVVEVDAGGPGAPRQATNHAGPGHVYDFEWSPDGRRLLYRVSGSPPRLFVADIEEATPVARRVDDPELGQVTGLGWMSAQQIIYSVGVRFLLVDLVAGVPSTPEDPAGGMATAVMAPDRSAVVTEAFDGDRIVHYWISLQPSPGPPRLMATPEAAHFFRFTSSSRWLLDRVQLPTQTGFPKRFQLLAFDAQAPEAEPILLMETDVMSAVPVVGTGDLVLVAEDEPDRPLRLHHANLAGTTEVQQVIADPPLDWTIGDIAWSPAL